MAVVKKKVVKKKIVKPAVEKTVKKVEPKRVLPVNDAPASKEAPTVAPPAEETIGDKKKKAEYLFGIGRRKSAAAQVRVYKKGTGMMTVNGKDFKVYFPASAQQEIATSPLKIVGQEEKLDVTVKVAGGGFMSQTEAVRHGLSRALLLLNPNFKKPLKKAGFLTRDPRKKERKKPGLKRARKAPQWAKR